ncbi:DUF5808 domain-containing protein [Paenibacillus kobensis]|uniref:DUF5808 domain-containing protein n=1 Tax=Paenibacillus kobensis TaxID=59841 RepID=UPI000FD88670|nr:DUF5808 domain-containing protein [Paenibacillus kobensis]
MFVTFMLIHFIPAIILYSVLWATYRPLANYKNGMLFAVTLPAHAMEHPAIGEIRARFKKQFTQVSVWLGVALVPLVIMNMWDRLLAYSNIYFFLWLALFIVYMIVPPRRAFRATLALKREHEWFVGKKNVVHSDTRVARLKNARNASTALFIIPLAISIGTLLWVRSDNSSFSDIGYAGIGITILFIICSYYMRRMKAKVYSENSDINLSLNQARRRSLTYMWLLLAIIESIHFPIIYLLVSNDNPDLTGLWIAVTVLFSLIPIALTLVTYRRIHAQEQEVVSQDGQLIYSDDDEYWANGFTYHNPNDSAVFVPKRVGIGSTINTGTLAGKIMAGAIVVLLAGAIFFVSFMLILSELTSPTLTVTKDRQVEIDYPMYSYDFPLVNIEQLDLVDQVPKGYKVNGEGTTRVNRGKFSLNGLGTTRLYIYKNNPPYIRIKLPNTYIFFNDEDPERTKQLYVQLQLSMQQ